MRVFKAAAMLSVTALLIVALNQRWFNLPPLVKFLNPNSGIWRNSVLRAHPENVQLKIEKLSDSVLVKIDTSLVPHIFANNEYDLYFVQGFVTASERLWQMELQARKAEGRLSEIFGAATLQQDIYFRRLQLQTAAQQSLELMGSDCNVKTMLGAYADGVNAYIAQLKDRNLPVEYKLFDHKPGKWLPVHSVLIMKLMAETLAGGSDDLEMSQVLQHFGKAVTDDLYPDYPYKESPVIPTGTPWNFTAKSPLQQDLGAIVPVTDEPMHAARNEGIGSNNWAVSGKKSRTGFPLLANDPHLRLTLPSIWYQVQLSAPGQNVYGVTMPGIPSVVIGFNNSIAWGVTNVYADVMDWYKLDFKDETCREYAYGNRWMPVREKKEIIKVRGGGAVEETILLTHYGPVMTGKTQRDNKTMYALKWIAHQPSQEIASFYYLNHANNFSSFKHALTYFTSPAQNFVYADKYQHIAMVAAGKFPLKQHAQGKYVLDGRDPNNEWRGWIPGGENPSVLDPQRQFVSSANQSLTDQSYPYYINWKYSPSERARRINARLTEMQDINVDSFQSLQNDKYSMTAEDVLPFLLSNIDNNKISAEQKQVRKLLGDWDKNLYRNSAPATFFNAWFGNLSEAIWADDFAGNTNIPKPNRDRTVKLLCEEPSSKWYDDKNTAVVEKANDIILRSFQYTADSLLKKFGAPGREWEWGKHKATIVEHVGKISSFGTGFFSSEGSASTVDAMAKTTGPSWRMIVELGEEVRAYGILPGGQSGNPGSFYYDNELEQWKRGKLRPLNYFKNQNDVAAPVKSTITFKN
jgi:penicillin G amidase